MTARKADLRAFQTAYICDVQVSEGQNPRQPNNMLERSCADSSTDATSPTAAQWASLPADFLLKVLSQLSDDR